MGRYRTLLQNYLLWTLWTLVILARETDRLLSTPLLMDQLPIWRPSKELLAVQAISRKITLLVLYTLTPCQNLKHQLKIKQGIGDQKAGLTSSSLTPFLPEVQKQEKEKNIARTVFLSIIILPLLFIYYSICFALSCLDCFHTSYFISSHFISSQ